MPGNGFAPHPLLRLAAWTSRRLPVSAREMLYRMRPLASLIRRGLNRAAPHGLTDVTVAAGDLAGATLRLDLQSEKDYWLGTYEPELQAAIRDWVKPGSTVYDVGANIGYISLLLARRVGSNGHVISFEALPANLERLHANIALNNLAEQVRVTSAAVIDGERPVRFLIGPSGGMGKAEGSAGRGEVSYPEAVTVDGVSLDAFVYGAGWPAPQAIKMDIEGGEVLALPGMSRLLIEAHPVVFLELHGPEAGRAAWEAFKVAGYRIFRMQAGYPAVASLDELDWKAYLVAAPGGQKVEGSRG